MASMARARHQRREATGFAESYANWTLELAPRDAGKSGHRTGWGDQSPAGFFGGGSGCGSSLRAGRQRPFLEVAWPTLGWMYLASSTTAQAMTKARSTMYSVFPSPRCRLPTRIGYSAFC